MAFDQSSIGAVSLARDGAELLVSWTSTAAEGTTFQLYADGALAWAGTTRSAHLPWPRGRNVRVSVGAVAVGEDATDFSGSLPTAPSPARTLSWEGGTYLAADIAGFRVHSSAVAGGAVDFTRTLATVPAYIGGIVTDGYGLGGYGHGGYGRSASVYTWRTAALGNGVWTFAIVPFDTAGNAAGSPSTVAFTVACPPRPPAADSKGKRLSYTYNNVSHVATLTWLASPA